MYVCSPFRGDIETNVTKARNYCRKLFEAGYKPFAPHLLFPQFLDEEVPTEREAGLEMGEDMFQLCHLLVICGNTITEGMQREIETAERTGLPVTTLDKLLGLV